MNKLFQRSKIQTTERSEIQTTEPPLRSKIQTTERSEIQTTETLQPLDSSISCHVANPGIKNQGQQHQQQQKPMAVVGVVDLKSVSEKLTLDDVETAMLLEQFEQPFVISKLLERGITPMEIALAILYIQQQGELIKSPAGFLMRAFDDRGKCKYHPKREARHKTHPAIRKVFDARKNVVGSLIAIMIDGERMACFSPTAGVAIALRHMKPELVSQWLTNNNLSVGA